MLPFYHNHLQSNLNSAEFLIFKILLSLLQINKWARLESLATSFPLPIKFESRRRKLQRFLSSNKLNIQTLWHPILEQIIANYYPLKTSVYLVIDRTRWKNINILMISLLYQQRAIPVYFKLLDKKGNSNAAEQIEALSIAISLLKNYHKIVLGDREFCSVDLAKWLSGQEKTDFSLRIKKNEYVEINKKFQTLKELNLNPGMSVYYEGTKITKSKGFSPVNLAAKWKKTYKQKKSKEPWFIMTSLNNLEETTLAYSKRMGIEEMFRDFKKGGYNLEETGLTEERLLALVLLITFAYTEATFSGNTIQKIGISNYLGRTKEANRSTRRHSRFYLGLHGKDWVNTMEILTIESELLMLLSPQKLDYYKKGKRAVILASSAF